jgi:hypothetical protein
MLRRLPKTGGGETAGFLMWMSVRYAKIIPQWALYPIYSVNLSHKKPSLTLLLRWLRFTSIKPHSISQAARSQFHAHQHLAFPQLLALTESLHQRSDRFRLKSSTTHPVKESRLSDHSSNLILAFQHL